MRKLLILVLASLLAACAPVIVPREPVDPNTAGAITIPHTMGEAVLPGPALRVVALEWTYVENLLALGIQPVGVADIEGFNTWVNVPAELSPDVVDVGMRGEPDFETLAALQPDLIIDTQATAAGYYEQLDAIAPTLAFNPYPDDPALSTFAEMQDSFRLLGQATGRSEQAEQVLAGLDAQIAAGREAIAASGHAGEPFVLAQMMSYLNNAYLRFFIDNGHGHQHHRAVGAGECLGQRVCPVRLCRGGQRSTHRVG
ncbi:MAG: iron-siderophore ABC transporter substrate-binding protein [Anaerolineales bacterium]|nr:iron-siderophore ABC transporter substrate-binding protein [Anaerolineales bacterium]